MESLTGVTARETSVDVAVIGAGPAGLAAACECRRRGLSHVVIDRKGLGQSFSEYPHNLLFFSPPDEMEIAGVPLPVAGGLKPTRETYLAYLRAVARVKRPNLLTWHRITRVEKDADTYRIQSELHPVGIPAGEIRARAIVVATGMWDKPCRLNVPGEQLPHVITELRDPTPYFGQPLVVIGGGNSAVGGALILAEARAGVTLSMRRKPKNYRSGLRPFVKRDLGFAVEEGKVRLYSNTVVREIKPDRVVLQPAIYTGTEDLSEGTMADYELAGDPFEVPARFVFALIGHQPDTDFLAGKLDLKLRQSGRPVVDPHTWETSQKNIFAAGSVAREDIDIVLKLREQSTSVIGEIAKRILTS